VHGEQREALLTLSRQAKERGWWQSYVSAIPEWFQVYVGLEAEASTIHLYESELVDGLLQTPGYYRTFLRAAPAAAGENEAERKIEVRLARQERLTSDDPPEYWAVLNEAVIRRGRATGAWTATRPAGSHGHTSPSAKQKRGQILRRTVNFMERASGGDRYITWPPHPDPLVEQMFRDADRAGYTIMQVKGVEMLVTPDVLDDFYFVGRVVPSSAAWRHMVRELRDWLDFTGRRAPGRQV
jgi:hypothetical protein